MLVKSIKVFFIICLLLFGSNLTNHSYAAPTSKINTLSETDIFLRIGDKYFENEQYEESLIQYRLALAGQPRNTDIIKRIVKVIIEKYKCQEYQTILLYPNNYSIGVGTNAAKIAAATKNNLLKEGITFIYRAQSINSELENKLEWARNEMMIQVCLGEYKLATKALEKILHLHRNNADVLTQIGELRYFNHAHSNHTIYTKQTIDILVESIKIAPKKIKSCYYLAKMYTRVNEPDSQIQEAYRCLKLADQDKSLVSNQYNTIAELLYNSIIRDDKFHYKGILSDKLKISIAERSNIVEYLSEKLNNTLGVCWKKLRLKTALLALNIELKRENRATELLEDLWRTDYKPCLEKHYHSNRYSLIEIEFLLQKKHNSIILHNLDKLLEKWDYYELRLR